MRSVFFWAVVMPACTFAPSGNQGNTDAPAASDAAVDARPDAPRPDGPLPCSSFSSLFDTCALGASSADVTIAGNPTYNTDTHELVVFGGLTTRPAHAVVSTSLGSIDVLLADNFSLPAGATLKVIGTIPFGIAARGNVTISGAIDLAAGGAGSRSGGACSTPTGSSAGGKGSDGSGGAGGGGGGGFHGTGGAGGVGDVNHNVAGSAGGAPGVSVARPSVLRGGCSGGKGGDGDNQTGGLGGLGGGAVIIATPNTLAVSGAVDVGGGGGGGGKVKRGGGGGGGSGGMIVLECKALELTPTGAIVANGGGGGEGGDREGPAGRNGANGNRSAMQAAGGTGQAMSGADGGLGGAGTNLNGATPTDLERGGGGGGGGGTGFIAIACPPFANNGVISPAFAPWP